MGIDRSDLDRELPLSNPRQIEQVIDEPHLQLQIAAHDLDRLPRFGRAILREHFKAADDGGKGGAQFVGEHRQKLIFGANGCFGLLFGPFLSVLCLALHLLRALQFGNIVANAVNKKGDPLLVVHDLDLPVHPHRSSIFGQKAVIAFERSVPGDRLGEIAAQPLLVIGMEPLIPEQRRIQPFARRVTEQTLDLWTDINLAPLVPQARGSDKGHRWNLLDQSLVLGFDAEELVVRRLLDRVPTVPGSRPHRIEKVREKRPRQPQQDPHLCQFAQ